MGDQVARSATESIFESRMPSATFEVFRCRLSARSSSRFFDRKRASSSNSCRATCLDLLLRVPNDQRLQTLGLAKSQTIAPEASIRAFAVNQVPIDLERAQVFSPSFRSVQFRRITEETLTEADASEKRDCLPQVMFIMAPQFVDGDFRRDLILSVLVRNACRDRE